MSSSTRRGFIGGCSAAIAAMAGARFGKLAFAGTGSDNDETLVVVFLRGGVDGLNVVVPTGGFSGGDQGELDRATYEQKRPDLKVPVAETDTLGSVGDVRFGLHPAMGPLFDLYQSNHLSLVVAAGLAEANRSHFEAQDFMDLGTPGVTSTSSGWLTRHLESARNLPVEILMPAMSVGGSQATSLLGSTETVNVSSTGSFNLEVGPWRWRALQRTALRTMYGLDDTWLHTSGRQALDALDIVELNASGSYTPSNGAVYPSDSLGDHLKVVAQMIKLGLGLRCATVDYGGWDSHENQGDGSGGNFAARLDTLARGHRALYQDLDGPGGGNHTGKLTVVCLSEFGRRLRQNANDGSDHGHGNFMMVMSGNATGGLHGSWPGLQLGQLFDDNDLAVTTDFRRVLAEILIRRLGNNHLGYVFPGYTGYQPMGLVSGPDLSPNYSPTLDGVFTDGFESGGLDVWSSSVG